MANPSERTDVEADRIGRIRRSEKEYHERCYERHGLFEPGSWLHKPAQVVLDGLDGLYSAREARGDTSGSPENDGLRALDLGCGVGRHAIPLAERMYRRGGGRVVCVDLLDTALAKLRDYGRTHRVEDLLETEASDIGTYVIEPESFDYVVAVSSLEHLASEALLRRTLAAIERGVRPGGAVCLILNTSSREIVVGTGEELEPALEINLKADKMRSLLARTYRDAWQIRRSAAKSLAFEIEREGRTVRLESESLTFYATKNRTRIRRERS